MSYNPYGNLTEQKKANEEKLHQENQEINKLCYRVFSTEDGVKFLEYLTKNTIDKPSYIHGVTDSVNATLIREGQNQIVREIHARIKFSQQQ